MKLAIITDIHANLEALKAVLKDIEKNNITDILSLGDNVGYGPNPVEVLEILYEKEIDSLLGNHDLAVVQPSLFNSASDLAVNAINWTRQQLNQAVEKDANFSNILDFYLNFNIPSSTILENHAKTVFTHGCPGDRHVRFEYLLAPEDFVHPCQYLQKNKLKICFFGHTHRQIFWEIDQSGISLLELEYDEPVEFSDQEIENSKLFINPGAVGQPRDGNPDASYMIYEPGKDGHVFIFKRVEYDIDAIANKIYNIKQLDNRLGDRLKTGT